MMNQPNFYEMIGFQSETPEPHHGPPDPPDFDRAAFLLDIDGTLVDIAGRPDEVSVPDETRNLVNDLHARSGGATVLVSGRRIGDLDEFFPDFEGIVIGSHGAERREGGELWQHPAQGSRDLVRLYPDWVRACGGQRAELLFVGGKALLCVVLHYRQPRTGWPEGLKFMQLHRADHARDGFMPAPRGPCLGVRSLFPDDRLASAGRRDADGALALDG